VNPIYLMATCILSLLYFWVTYNVPILAVGFKRLCGGNKERTRRLEKEALPVFSIVVPMKNEERVAERALRALLKLDYPPDRREIIVIEDGSTDRTAEICAGFAERYPGQVRLVRKPRSEGKPSALNHAMEHARGEIIAVFDADSVPEKDALLKAAGYFQDPMVAAVQGTMCSINADENMLTKFLSYEEAAWFRAYIQGKDALNLFVPLTGSCQFVRRSVLERVGGWDEDSLSEDVEMSAKLTDKGYGIRYAPDIFSWQESPANIPQLIRQRTRWFRGYMETALKYGRLIRRVNKRSIDAEITLMGPYMFTLCLVGYLTALYSLLTPTQPGYVFTLTARVISVLNLATLLIIGLALIYATKPRRIRNLLWLPFIYTYWGIQTFVALRALVQVVLRKPREWTKTTKTGAVTGGASGARVSVPSRL